MIKLKSTKKRSKRLQKKLHLGEFTSHFVEFIIKFKTPCEDPDSFKRHDDIAEVVHWFGGGYCFSGGSLEITGAFDYYAKHGNLTQEAAYKLSKIQDVSEVQVSAPVDAWYYEGFDLDEDLDLCNKPGTVTLINS